MTIIGGQQPHEKVSVAPYGVRQQELGSPNMSSISCKRVAPGGGASGLNSLKREFLSGFVSGELAAASRMSRSGLAIRDSLQHSAVYTRFVRGHTRASDVVSILSHQIRW